MDSEVLENIFLLVLVTLLSVVQNAFFALKVEKECTGTNSKQHSAAFERLSCATMFDGIRLKSKSFLTAPAAFAGVIYLVVRQKYFVGYMGQTCQSIPGFLFGKRVLFFLSLMCIVGIINYLLLYYAGEDYRESIQTIIKAASTLLLLP
ncbi:Arachidonate 5-lipoxygenase-activating protein [Triplophysa tibetana]|uniref:Arachidonate 5-lipoxygenase-activating protein n=1 Tax=Triplophysa tibetana TaxID=1572043 RepID=A0A5A9N4L8_9TELE|nr:Arachidonate 5-lipoxygenase-activating protein [Triplophysa tibetana]